MADEPSSAEQCPGVDATPSSVSMNAPILKMMELHERRDFWKSIAIVLVSMFSLLLLGILSYGQLRESRARREANEDLEWRETLRTISVGPNKVDTLTVSILLKPFLRSPRYKNEALITTRLLLPRMTSYDGFEYLFKSAYNSPADNLSEVIDISKKLYERYEDLLTLRDSLPKESRGKNDEPFSGTASTPNFNIDLKQRIKVEIDEVVKEMTLVGNRIGELLRNRRVERSGNLDLTHTLFYECDLSGADLHNATLAHVTIQKTDISGARLTDIRQFETTIWWDTQWWKAEEISAALLIFLKGRYPPYYQGDIYGEKKITKDEYLSNLQRLCYTASIDCSKEVLKFPSGTSKRSSQ